MNPDEFRIGDWVSYCHEPVKVAEMNLTYITAWKKDGIFCNKLAYKAVDPIILTGEVLEKNGWKKHSDYMSSINKLLYHRYSKEHVCLHEETDGSFRVKLGNMYLYLNFIHQLQHLLWVLGKRGIELY